MDSFEQKCVIIKGLLLSKRLEKHMVDIGFDQSLSNSDLYKHRCLENIKKLYKTAGKYEDQQHYKTMIESAMVSTPEGCIEKSPMITNPYVSDKKPSAIKSLHKFTETLDVKHKTDVNRFGGAKAKHKGTKKDNALWSITAKLCDHTK